jgi:D-beta-D-heptose 7-phosphate kinase/D-beta-D-heptose 1-phosphate adenosyltransferase
LAAVQHLRPIVEQLRGCRVLVIGDVMLDEYLRGDVSRISPEAPVPVLEVRAREHRLGGAANAAANIQVLGGATTVIGLVGEDDTAQALSERLVHHEINVALVADRNRPTSKKTRLVAQQQQIVRVDHEVRTPVAGDVADALRRAIDTSIQGAQACVLSDYAKGVITADVARHAIAAARVAGVPVIVDPKQRDFAVYRGATVITPNLHELDAAAPVYGHDVEQAARRLLPIVEGAALLVTRSADGMSLFRAGQDPFHVRAFAREVFDVTGAGDTVVATIALALAARIPMETAIELASVAAAVAVSKRGTSTVSPAELVSEIDAHAA